MHNSDPPEKAVTTHPAILRAVIRLVQAVGGHPVVGDSPGVAYRWIERAWRRTGLRQAAEEMGAEVVNFAEVKVVKNPGNRRIPKLHLARPVMDADVVISLPKLKTHNFALFTGAVKNLYGVIPGVLKKELHGRAPRPIDFAALLADILAAVRPNLAIMDGVVGMEGDGPVSGRPRKVGVVLASRDSVALDAVASSIIGYNPLDVDSTLVAHRRGLGCGFLERINLKGVPLDQVRVPDFERSSSLYALLKPMPSWALFALKPIAERLLTIRPQADDDNCIGCGDCVKACPDRAIHLNGNYPVIDYRCCSGCFCCVECCPVGAMQISRNWLARKFQM